MNQRFLIEYRASIALNNVAVTLLERKAYRASLKTLTECCALMESALRHQHSSNSEPADQRAIEQMIQKSSRRLSRSYGCELRAREVASSPDGHHPDSVATLRVVSHDGSYLDVMSPKHSITTFLGQEAKQISPIRLETLDSQRFEERNPEFESGIMIFNLGISYLCLAHSHSQQKSPSGSFKLREAAANIFKMAYEIVTKPKTLKRLLDYEDDDHRLLLDTHLLLAHMILSHTVQAHMDNGKVMEAREAYQRMTQLASTIQELGIPNTPFEACAAAAA
jgi:hypothetical protein